MEQIEQIEVTSGGADCAIQHTHKDLQTSDDTNQEEKDKENGEHELVSSRENDADDHADDTNVEADFDPADIFALFQTMQMSMNSPLHMAVLSDDFVTVVTILKEQGYTYNEVKVPDTMNNKNNEDNGNTQNDNIDGTDIGNKAKGSADTSASANNNANHQPDDTDNTSPFPSPAPVPATPSKALSSPLFFAARDPPNYRIITALCVHGGKCI